MSRLDVRIRAQMMLLLLLLVAATASAAPARTDDTASLAPSEPAAAAAAADGSEGAPLSAASLSERSAPGEPAMTENGSEATLYKILLDLTDRHRVKRPSVMGLDNYDEATTTLELLRQRHKSRPRNQKPTPNPEVIRRILRILAMGKK